MESACLLVKGLKDAHVVIVVGRRIFYMVFLKPFNQVGTFDHLGLPLSHGALLNPGIFGWLPITVEFLLNYLSLAGLSKDLRHLSIGLEI
ncbi:MAG: hypothetical protein COX20_11000 [Desulfobacterales bacterium CG23_combo_of_CG06-09_8_20_14_all_52_9]|nr:MAG: hypothetical protein COX20_11000 [Desulfobacterales bacterium CG23_combo_of_CG06-09_8_20_14_all_52_9]